MFPKKGVSLILHAVLLPPANSRNQPHSLSPPIRARARVEGFYTLQDVVV